jgi:hypothetical protein
MEEQEQLYADFTVQEDEACLYYEPSFAELLVQCEIPQEELNDVEKAA